MKKVKKNVKRFIRACLFLVLLFVGLLLFAFFFLELEFPQPLLRAVLRKLSTEQLIVAAQRATFQFTHGLKIADVKVYHRAERLPNQPLSPILRASLVDLALNLRQIPWSRDALVRGVTLYDFAYPRLPKGYYIPDSIEYPGSPDFRESNEPVQLELPNIQPFQVRLVRSHILGIETKLVEVEKVGLTPTGLRAHGIHIQWPDADALMTLDGEVEMDLGAQLVKGEVHGLARQHNIRPLLVALEITNSYSFMDAFTKVERPIPASCAFDVNLRNKDLHLLLNLHPEGGFHHGVPLKEVQGPLDIRVFVRDTYQNAHILVGPLHAELADGSKMDGAIFYENTNDVGFVNFDVRSSAPLASALAIAGVMQDGTLDCLQPLTPPTITLKGRLAVNPVHGAANDLLGYVAFQKGTLFQLPLEKASSIFHVKGSTVSFREGHAFTPRGGRVTGTARIETPDFKQDHASFQVNITSENVPLRDLAEPLHIDLGEMQGKISGHLCLAGPLSTNALPFLCGTGRVDSVDDHGRLASKKLFTGLSKFLYHTIPGASHVISGQGASLNFSRVKFDYVLTNGVLTTSNFEASNHLLTVRGKGSVSLLTKQVRFKADVVITKPSSKWLNGVTLPITLATSGLTGLLFRFDVSGPLDEPIWKANFNPLSRLPAGLFKKN